MTIIERGTLAVDVERERRELSHTLLDEAAIIQAAKRLHVQEVVLVDRGGDYQALLIAVQGVQIESGQVHWSGMVFDV
ncbi:MAG: hypothetical protein ACREJN_06885 [Nitrospiraceae bacterium]